MAWFKVDDQFYDHPKVADLPPSAIGLWIKAGSYCARYETDGSLTSARVQPLGGRTRDPDRLAEIQHLQEALRKKNEKHRRLRGQYKRLKDSKRRNPRIHAYVSAVSRFEIPIYGAPLKLPHYWHAEIRKNARKIDSSTFLTHHEALEWALEQVKISQEGE